MRTNNRQNVGIALLIVALLIALNAPIVAAQQAPNFAGTWQMTMEGGRGGGGGGGNGGGGNGGGNGGGGGENGGGGGGGNRGGGGPQTLTIAQDGGQYKVTHTTPRGDMSYTATVSGNAISWTEMRQGRDGNTMSIEYKATVDGDTMTGTMGGGQFNRPFTAKRSS
jgi:hypothetical protein